MEPLQFVSAILLATPDPEALATWYIDTLGIPLVARAHNDEPPHYECMVGNIHFAIHPDADAPRGGAVDLAFHVFDLPGTVEGLVAKGIVLDQPLEDHGFTHLAAIRDPAGNRIWLSQVTPWMVQAFEEQRATGHDVATIARRRGIAPD